MDTLLAALVAVILCAFFLRGYLKSLKKREEKARESAEKGKLFSEGPKAQHPHIDTTYCTGCQTCVERCHFDAIEMKKVPGSKKMKTSVIKEHCMGCGLCIYKCPSEAMHFELIRPAEHIPTAPRFDASTMEGQRANAAMAKTKATATAEAKAAEANAPVTRDDMKVPAEKLDHRSDETKAVATDVRAKPDDTKVAA